MTTGGTYSDHWVLKCVSLLNFRVIFSPFPELYLIVTSFDFARVGLI